MQNSEVTYEYKITNKSELDYDSKEFYITGEQKGKCNKNNISRHNRL